MISMNANIWDAVALQIARELSGSLNTPIRLDGAMTADEHLLRYVIEQDRRLVVKVFSGAMLRATDSGSVRELLADVNDVPRFMGFIQRKWFEKFGVDARTLSVGLTVIGRLEEPHRTILWNRAMGADSSRRSGLPVLLQPQVI